MKKVTKAIKLVSTLTEEEKQEFAEFFAQEIEEEPTKEPKKEEPKKEIKDEVKTEVKEEPKKEEPKKEFDFDSFLNRYQEDMKVIANEVKTLKEQKAEVIGIKAKAKESKGENSFDDVFARLQK